MIGKIKSKAATCFLNVLDRIPKLMEQYRTENEKLEKDLPALKEIVGGTWKKEEELKQLKSEMATLERKIQLTLTPIEHQSEKKSTDENMPNTVPEISERFYNVRAEADSDKKTMKGLRM